MNNWAEFKLGELAEKIALGPFGSNIKVETFKPFGIPIISGGHLHQTRLQEESFNYISVEHADRLLNSNVYRGDVIFTHAGNVGQVSFIPENSKYQRYIISQRQFYLRCNRLKLDHEYITYYFKSPIGQHQLLSNVNQTGVPSLAQPGSYLKQLVVKVPPLNEQKAIAAVLSSLDDKIDLLHRQNKTLEAMAASLFRRWFVDEAQEDWEEGTLGDVAINVRNSVKTSDIQSDARYVGLEHIDRRNIALQQYSFGEVVSSNKSAFESHDILFGKLRPYFHKVCFAPFAGICSTDILVIRPKRPEWFAFCLFAFFQDEVVEFANLGSGGTRMPRTDWGSLKSYPVCLPDIDNLNDFNAIVLPSIEKITSNLEQIRTLETLRDTLLPKLMSGEVRVV